MRKFSFFVCYLNVSDCEFSLEIIYKLSSTAWTSSCLKMNITHPPANSQALCSCTTGKPQRSNISSVITSNGHSLMKCSSSALGRCLVDVAVLVACSCADSLPLTFVGPYLVA